MKREGVEGTTVFIAILVLLGFLVTIAVVRGWIENLVQILQ